MFRRFAVIGICQGHPPYASAVRTKYKHNGRVTFPCLVDVEQYLFDILFPSILHPNGNNGTCVSTSKNRRSVHETETFEHFLKGICVSVMLLESGRTSICQSFTTTSSVHLDRRSKLRFAKTN